MSFILHLINSSKKKIGNKTSCQCDPLSVALDSFEETVWKIKIENSTKQNVIFTNIYINYYDICSFIWMDWIVSCLYGVNERRKKNSMWKARNIDDFSKENGVFHIVSRESGFVFHRFSEAILFWEFLYSSLRPIGPLFFLRDELFFFHFFEIYLQWSVIFYFLIIINPSFLHYYWSFFLLLPYVFLFKYAFYFYV